MKTANIHTEAKVTLNSNFTTDDEPIHTIEFDGVVADIIGDEPSKREIEIFKRGILYLKMYIDIWLKEKNRKYDFRLYEIP